ncbi:MAG: hypothetical protein R2857_11935 [Vampirovibrionales bacterium]
MGVIPPKPTRLHPLRPVGIGAGAGTGQNNARLASFAQQYGNRHRSTGCPCRANRPNRHGVRRYHQRRCPSAHHNPGCCPAGNYAGGGEDQVLMGLFGIMMTLIMKLIDKVSGQAKTTTSL